VLLYFTLPTGKNFWYNLFECQREMLDQIGIIKFKEENKMKHNFEIGDRVKVLTNKSVYYGKSGKVVGVNDNFISVEFEVHIGNGETELRYSHFKNPDSIEKIGTKSKRKPKFEVGDTVKVTDTDAIARTAIGTITDAYTDYNGSHYKGEAYTVKFKTNMQGRDNYVYSPTQLTKVEPKPKSEWRPKKGELIEVSHEGSDFYSRPFRVFMDGLYWCDDENIWICKLSGYEFAKPIEKVEPKFKVGETVMYKSLGLLKIIGIGKINSTGQTYLVDYNESGKSSFIAESLLEKVSTIPIEDGKISFRGLSKGIMVDKNIVMYYSHRYDRILISEAEKPLPKKYAWIECKKEELRKGDVFTTDIFSKEYIFYDNRDLYSTTKDNPIQRILWQSFPYNLKFYKAIEV
jgi:hypothetical protein